MTTTADWRHHRDASRQLDGDSLRFPDHLVEIPIAPAEASPGRSHPVKSWRSRHFLVVLWDQGGHPRLTIQRCKLRADGQWMDGITWEELQRLKSEAGFGAWWAVELFPADASVVNVANMRHLFLLPAPPSFAWKANPCAPTSDVAGALRSLPESTPSTSSPSSPTTPPAA